PHSASRRRRDPDASDQMDRPAPPCGPAAPGLHLPDAGSERAASSEKEIPMYNRVLVSLDGSDLAESILPFAEQVAGPLDAELLLLRVVEPVTAADAVAAAGLVSPDTYTLRELDAKRYLAGLETRLKKKGLRTQALTVVGAPAEEI